MANIPQHLVRGATLFARCAGKHHAILIGGVAANALGSARKTTDLDFNLQAMPKTLRESLTRGGINICVYKERKDRFSGNLEESVPGAKDAVKFDIAVHDNVLQLLRYTTVTEMLPGVRVADERLLLVMKIISLAERSGNVDAKISSDSHDIVFCLGLLDGGIPDELVALISDRIWKMFWARLKDYVDDETFEGISFFFGEQGLPVL
ncbi:hypothetical protein C8R47DRAFT_483897 [Mycena vitilis]|nr:hypothetical protein C8R47DRAFT_483897 [Mycena vitilis]